MAGRFVSLEEAARLLGVSVDEVNRLVDRKKLFPMRDGASVKFRSDDVERVAHDLGSDASQSGDLSLDLDLPAQPKTAGADADSIQLGDPIDTGDFAIGDPTDGGGAIEETIVRGGASPVPAPGTAPPATGSVFDDLGGDGDAELSLEPQDSIIGASAIGASSPSLARQSQTGSTGVVSDLGDSLAINMSNISGAGASQASSAPSLASKESTLMLSGKLDSGLSLEGNGIDVASGEASVLYPNDGSGTLSGDEFLLGGETADEESASVVIPTEETESSFFGTAAESEASQFTAGGSSADSQSALGVAPEFMLDTPFSGWQITGLICCSLLLLCGGFVVFDLVRTIGSAEGPMLANPVLDRIAETFGWR